MLHHSLHLWLVANNLTTVEMLEKRGCSPPPGFINRYDLVEKRWVAMLPVSGELIPHAM